MILLGFVVLQLLDALTTLFFLRNGVAEANPLIRAALALSGNPAVALTAPKVFAIGLALYAWRSGRRGLMARLNVLFALVVGWNLIAVAVR